MTYKFNNSELVDLLLIYGECCQSPSAARRRYAELYPSRYLPGNRVFASVVQRARETGKLQPIIQERGRERAPYVLEAETAILEAAERNPTLSTRQIARDLNVSHYTVWRTLKETQGSRPSHFNCQKAFSLESEDYPARAGFCQWLIDKYVENGNFPSSVLFTDEASFTNYGIVNIHDPNDRAPEIEHERFSVNVWAGIIGNSIIGPFILPDIVTESEYLNFLQNDLPPLLEEIPIKNRVKMWYQHEGAASYFTKNTRDYLTNEYEDRWIARGASIAWPPRSSDLNPVEFFLWGFLKQVIYETEISDVEELKNRIDIATTMIKEQKILEQRYQSLMQRAYKCVQSGGSAFQHLL